MLSRADAKVKELRKSIDLLKAESEKLEVSSYYSVAFILGQESKSWILIKVYAGYFFSLERWTFML